MIYTEKDGSAIIFVLLLITALCSTMYFVLHMNSYYISLAREREKYEIRYQLALSLSNFIMIKYADQCKKSDLTFETVLFDGFWPNKKNGNRGKVWISRKNDTTNTLTAVIIKNKQELIKITNSIYLKDVH